MKDLMFIWNIIIIYHDFSPPPMSGIVMSSQITDTIINIHPFSHMLNTCALISSSCALFTVYPNSIMWRHPIPLYVITSRAREGRPKNTGPSKYCSVKLNQLHMHQGSPLFLIVTQPPPSFLCCPRPPSHHPHLALKQTIETIWNNFISTRHDKGYI